MQVQSDDNRDRTACANGRYRVLKLIASTHSPAMYVRSCATHSQELRQQASARGGSPRSHHTARPHPVCLRVNSALSPRTPVAGEPEQIDFDLLAWPRVAAEDASRYTGRGEYMDGVLRERMCRSSDAR